MVYKRVVTISADTFCGQLLIALLTLGYRSRDKPLPGVSNG